MRNRLKFTCFLGAVALAAACGDDEGGSLAEVLTDTQPATPMQCPDGGIVLVSGQDTNLNGTLEASEITLSEPVCDPVAGDPGDPGDPGLNALVRTTPEPEGDNCANGGARIDTGLDDNDDGVLQDGEIDTTGYVCNGDQGPTGFSFLVRTSIDVEVECDNGGVRIESGLDLDRNDSLDDPEVTETTVVCSGGDGFDTLVDIQAEPPGGNCAAGGQQLRRGFDANDNGTLDPTEVDDVSFFCNPVAVLTNTSTAGPPDCPSAGIQLDTGVDTNANAVLEPDEITATRFFCSNQGETVLTTTSTEGPGANCTSGGLRIDTGNDANFNGSLDADEITTTVYTCDADPGLDGRGASALRVTAEPAGVNCAQGGTRVDTGPDTNGNNVLDDPEITETTYSCNGADRTLLVDAVAIPPGLTCINGGQEIIQGGDVDNDGVLDPSEIQSSTIVCSASEVVAIAILSPTLPEGIRTGGYSGIIEVIGGLGGTYEWTVQSGQLPPGLSLAPFGNPSNGVLSGTPTQAGTFTFTVAVRDIIRSSATASFTIEIEEACEPGFQGAAGGLPPAVGIPLPVGDALILADMIAADTSTTGWVYLTDTSGLQRVSKDGNTVEDLDVTIGLTTADFGQEIEVDGNNIYLVSDATTTNRRVLRLSTDGGQTFSVQDMITVPAGVSRFHGMAIEGNTLFVITNDFSSTDIYSADISGTLPAPATLEFNISSAVDNCAGLDVDSEFWYTACGTNRGPQGDDPVIRVNRATGAVEYVFVNFSQMNTDDSGNNAIEVQDIDSDGRADILFVHGVDSTGNKIYACKPGGSLPGLVQPLLPGVNTDTGIGVDRVNGVLWFNDNTLDDLLRLP
jgi:hypothetical protein